MLFDSFNIRRTQMAMAAALFVLATSLSIAQNTLVPPGESRYTGDGARR